MLKSSICKLLLRGAIKWTKSVGSSCPLPAASLNVRFASGSSRFSEDDSGYGRNSGPSRFSGDQGGYGRSSGLSRFPENNSNYGRTSGSFRFSENNSGRMFNSRPQSRGRFEDLKPIVYENLEKLEKNMYVEHPNVAKRPQEEVQNYLKEQHVTLKGKDIPYPVLSFEESTFPDSIKQKLSKFSAPTVIQAISWPVALTGRDIISIAKTGSGKTLAFILPAIMHILGQPKRKKGDGPGPVALVILPTRELAQQVEQVAREFCRDLDLSVTCCFGGTPRGTQASALMRGVDILVGTPGRLMDFLRTGETNLRRCSYLVLDEADRMLDMGFEPQIRSVVGQIRPDRQTLMFSATWPSEIRALAADFQTDPVFLNVGSLELAANPNIKQNVEIIEAWEKDDRLSSLMSSIANEDAQKTLIFTKTKVAADMLTQKMRRNGFPALAIHGNKNQTERDWVLREFRTGKAKILVATDVAARGLDVDDIKYVINYDYPNTTEDYVHRIGRTARGDKKGTSYTFFTQGDALQAASLIKILKEAGQQVPEKLSALDRGRY